MTWSVESLRSNPAARVRFPAGSGILTSFLILGVSFVFCSVLSLGHGRLARWLRWSTCDVGEATEGLQNELWHMWSDGRVGEWADPHSSNPFCRFTYVTDHSPTLPLLHLRYSSFSKPCVASPMSQELHLRHLVSRTCCAGEPDILMTTDSGTSSCVCV